MPAQMKTGPDNPVYSRIHNMNTINLHTTNKKHHNIVAPPVSSSPINELPAPGMLQQGGN